jgi:hypothetical protein
VELTGHSRAAQWMLLQQMVDEARGQVAADSPHALLTPAGRRTLSRPGRPGPHRGGGGPCGGHPPAAALGRPREGEDRHCRWQRSLAAGAGLAAAQVPVFVDVLSNLPASFDQIGATLENAARLQRAGVAVSFVQRGDASHNARKMRQLAGNAVANGLPWADGLAGLTRCRRRRSAWPTRSAASSRASVPTWCCGKATRWTWRTMPNRSGWAAGDADALAPDRTARPLPAAQRAALTS